MKKSVYVVSRLVLDFSLLWVIVATAAHFSNYVPFLHASSVVQVIFFRNSEHNFYYLGIVFSRDKLSIKPKQYHRDQTDDDSKQHNCVANWMRCLDDSVEENKNACYFFTFLIDCKLVFGII